MYGLKNQWGTRKYTSVMATPQFNMAISLSNIRGYCPHPHPHVLPCPKTQKQKSTCVDSRVHRVPENGHQPLGRCIPLRP